jgi:AcrR family transcriptional regulator
MATKPKKRLPRSERRRVIEDAASALIAERGYAATRLEDVAAAAGVTKQLLYRHFPSKKALHMALLSRHRDELLAGLGSGMSTGGPLAERLPRVMDEWFRYIEEHPYAAVMLFRDTTGDPELQGFYRELQASARAANVALLRSEPELDIPEDRLEPVAEFFRAANTGLAMWRADNPTVPRALVVSVAVATMLGGLGLGSTDHDDVERRPATGRLSPCE